MLIAGGMGFFEVPALNRKQPSTSFEIRGRDFIAKGREESGQRIRCRLSRRISLAG
jgi:hypothetical protein